MMLSSLSHWRDSSRNKEQTRLIKLSIQARNASSLFYESLFMQLGIRQFGSSVDMVGSVCPI